MELTLPGLSRVLGQQILTKDTVTLQAMPSKWAFLPGGASCSRGWSRFSPILVAFQPHPGEGSRVHSMQSAGMQPGPECLPPASWLQITYLL